MKKLLLAPLVLIALAILTLVFFWHWSYSTGDRAGYLQKFSHKGWICKTWEGELAMVTLPGTVSEKFLFTVHDEQVAQGLRKAMGQRVDLQYEEKVGLPGSCFGETRHFVVGFTTDGPVAPVPGAANGAAPAGLPASGAASAAAAP